MDPVTVEAVGMDRRAGAVNINRFIRFLRNANGRNQINAQEVESEGKDFIQTTFHSDDKKIFHSDNKQKRMSSYTQQTE